LWGVVLNKVSACFGKPVNKLETNFNQTENPMGSNPNQTFKRKLIATSVAAVMLGVSQAPAVYAEEAAAEEVVVTGIRASLKASMDQKREASGVQDVITAEDIGKFPDTNLAESLQRIPGVSINREGGEGSRVTVRGLDAQYNLVTQNGRTIAKTTGDRSFNFADIPAEMVAGVAISKTGNATMDSGGMGATIDYRSIRPLNNPGQKASIGGKIISEDSWDGGTTPELFGLYSNTFADDTIGVSVAIGYQKREDSLARAHIDNGWKVFPDSSSAATRADAPSGVDLISKPQSARYKFESTERERINGQLVLQWQPVENVKTTLDFDVYERSVYSDKNEISSWFTYPENDANQVSKGVWAVKKGVATPVIYSEKFNNKQDLSMAGGHFARKFSGESYGLNTEWEVNDSLKLAFDIAGSSASDEPDSPFGSDVNLSTAGVVRTSTSLSLNGDVFSVINGGAAATPADMQVTGSSISNTLNESDVAQFKLGGKFEINDENSIDFGVGSVEVTNRNRNVNVQQNGWSGLGRPGDVAAAFTGTEASARGRFEGGFAGWDAASGLRGGATIGDGTNLTNAKPMDTFFDWDLNVLLPLANKLYGATTTADILGDCGTAFCPSTNYARGTDRETTETTTSLYAQYNYEYEIFKANVGLRYEQTDVESVANNSLYSGAYWGPGDTEIAFDGQTPSYTSKTADYSRVLPNIDTSFQVSDDVIIRASVSKTIARPSYTDIASSVSVNSNYDRQTGYATGRQGNPALLPFESTNIDLATEWYYGDASYMSFGAFRKDVKNFISSQQVRYDGSYAPGVPDIYDPLTGAYMQEARAANPGVSDAQVLKAWIVNKYAGVANSGVTRTAADGTSPWSGRIRGRPGDPKTRFDIATPSNAGDNRQILGLEYAVQHMFGESGFGASFNATAVLSDLSYDPTVRDDSQRPLLGISDSANIVAFYDKDGWNARIAYNWRDAFLRDYNDEGNQGPRFVDNYYQIDLGVSYEVTENLKVSFDGINVTSNPYVTYARDTLQTSTYDETGSRWMLGANYSF
jgi:TonB-dependent receptor